MRDQVNECRFGGLTVRWVDGVIEPRPWTIRQSRWAAERAERIPEGPILELFAGAGHIGQEAARLSGRDLVQVELSSTASRCAAMNADHNGLGGRVKQLCCDVGALTEVHADAGGYPLVLIDAPYISESQCHRFPEDPRLAIDGGTDGLGPTRLALGATARLLKEGGEAIVQLGSLDQVDAMTDEPHFARGAPCDGPAPFEVAEIDQVRQDRILVLIRHTPRRSLSASASTGPSVVGLGPASGVAAALA